MNMITSVVAAMLILAVGIANAQDEVASTDVSAAASYLKKLPVQDRLRQPLEGRRMPSTASAAAWKNFAARTGEWVVEWNSLTGNPHRAYGGQYQLAGFRGNSTPEVDQAARRFLTEHAGLLKLDASQLQLRRADHIRNKWYVSYQQVKDGIPVMFSEVELRLSAGGNLMMFGSDFHPSMEVNTVPALSEQAALQAATRGMEVIPPATPPSSLYILPIEYEDHISYHLAYRFEFVTANPMARFVTYVDAHSGEILWRFNRVRNSISGKVSGTVHRRNVTDALTSQPSPDLNLKIGGVNVVTDVNGEFSFSGVGTTFTLTANLEGRFARVTRDDGASASITTAVQDGQNVDILWDATNSQTSERDAYFHTNVAHAFIKAIDPAFTGVDYRMPVKVNINQTCNAFWDGQGINFFRSGDGCRNTAEVPTVVYHEYGHAINDQLYIGQGLPDGLTNIAMHEGLADINAAFLVDDAVVGRGFQVNGGGIRNVNNNNRYPESVVGEVHNDGLILAGALWDLREALGLEIARQYSHFARYGTPDDPDLLKAYNEYFIEILIQDDDDGNLANLTPNFAAINQAFSAHGIGTASLLRISHRERDDAPASASEYLVQASVSTVSPASFVSVNRDAVTVHYSIDGANFKSVPMAFISGSTFETRIPRQMPGSVVSYYLRAEDNLGSSLVLPYGAPNAKLFGFLAGFKTELFDDLETDKSWKVGDPTDNATSGIWERVVPVGTQIDETLVQPENDHTPSPGRVCFVTGNAQPNAQPGFNDVDNGKTTLFSPVFDLTSYRNPVIRYYRWYSNNASANPGQDFWEVHISNDGGSNWIEIERTRETDNSWRKVVVEVKKLLPLTSTMLVRFIAQDQAPGSLVEAAVDDFEILDAENVTDVVSQPESPLPTELRLHASYPNPFTLGSGSNGTAVTVIQYELPRATGVKVSVYDVTGRLIRVLREGFQTAGKHALTWNGEDTGGKFVSSGTYFLVLEAEGRRLNRKVLVVK
jgi:Zn-dependent metalloprotease